MTDLNPQAEQMADESMVRTLDAQARAQSYLVEMFAGMATLKASAAEGRAVERWSNLYVDELNVSLAPGRANAMTLLLASFGSSQRNPAGSKSTSQSAGSSL